MDWQCKQGHDHHHPTPQATHQSAIDNPIITPLDDQMFPILGHLKLIALLVLSSLESYLILANSNPVSHVIPLSLILLLLSHSYLKARNPQVYLVDFSCYKPPTHCRVPFSSFIEHASLLGSFSKEGVGFMAKMLHRSGHGQETYLPPALHFLPPRPYHKESIDEVHMVLFPVLEDLLRKTGVSNCDIDILIVNCSGLCPSPSLTSMVIKRFKLRHDVKSYNISGMGCSAGMLAIDMAQSMLRVHRRCSYAVVLSTEILTTGWYAGDDKSKLALNCVFRMGGAAVLLTSLHRLDKLRRVKYRLVRTVRTQRAFTDRGYHSAWRDEDTNGITGVTLSRDILPEANETLRMNMTTLGLYTLPMTEKLYFAISILRKKLMGKSAEVYVPNFKTAIDHFCLPITGSPVIREMGKRLKLDERDMEAVMSTLHRFGNQSSSSLWYELAYIEAKDRVKQGDKVWQLGMGSGPKSTSVIWECVRPIVGEAKLGSWAESIDRYPGSLFDQTFCSD